jgi:two-component system, LuxR family, response regulator FixJ
MRTGHTVTIVDDDPAFRRSMERLLMSAGFATASYASGAALLEALSEIADGCLLVDVRLPGMDGLNLQIKLGAIGFRQPIIMMTGHGDVQTAVQAMKSGARDFIEKPFEDGRLLSAIKLALASRAPVGRDDEIATAAERFGTLSPRERAVLNALMLGQPNKGIAHDLEISVRTVEVHRARMHRRLGVRSLAEAVRVAVLASLAQA